MLTGWLIYSGPDMERNQEYIKWMLEEAADLDLNLTLLCKEELSLVMNSEKLSVFHQHTELDRPDFAIIRTIDFTLTKHLEFMGIKTFNSSEVSLLCNNKALTHQYLASLGIPMLETHVSHTNILLETPDQVALDYPFVLKTVSGRGGGEVFFIDSDANLEDICSRLPNREVILQKLAGQAGKDVRVFVIGKQIIAAVLRYSESDFRANHSLGGRSRLYELNDTESALVNKIISHFDFGLVGIDFVFDKNGQFLFNEIEDVVGSRTLSLNSDINIVRLYLQFIKGNIQAEKGRND